MPRRYDGDTPLAERDWARQHGRWLFSNPDMLHRSLLPQHARWASYLRRLRYVVLDECHTYRGLFGSHVALLLRRLLRVCARYGARPTIVLASATVAAPAAFATRLVGREVVAVSDDGSPTAGRTVALWEPPLLDELTGENGAPVRRSAGAESARMLADLVIEGARTLAFVRSRRGAELTALGAQRVLAEVEPALVARVSPYRGGYLPEERRALEAALVRGDLLGVATTNALELGVDIAGLDAVVVAGFPGTRASFWQQAGRAGRGRDEALVVLVARDDPLDTYLVHHPDALLGAPVEGCVLDPANPYVLAPHLACAAAELPLTEADVDAARRACGCGGAGRAGRPTECCAAGRPGGSGRRRRTARPARWTCAGPGRGRWRSSRSTRVGCSARWRAPPRPRAVHPGAVYLHRGESYVVDDLDLDARLALVHAAAPDWRTDARSTADVAVMRVTEHRDHGAVRVSFGEVSVTDAGDRLSAPHAGRRRAGDRAAGHARADARDARRLVRRRRRRAARRGCAGGAHPRRAARRRARRDRAVAPVRDLRPVGHRRDVDARPPAHRLRRPSSSTTATRAAQGSPSAATPCSCPG